MHGFGTERNRASTCPCCRPCVMLSRDGKKRGMSGDKQIRRMERKRARRVAADEIETEIFESSLIISD